MFRPEFITVEGLRLLRLDYRGLSCAELETAFLVAERVMAKEPPRSVRVLALFDSRFDARSAEALKRCAEASAPYIHATGIVARGFWRAIFTSLKLGARPDLECFEDEATALAWLLHFQAPGTSAGGSLPE